MIDYIILAVVVAALVFGIFRLIRRKRSGTGCAGCSACMQADSCPSKDSANTK